jgi:curved DNA-binding protein CbpA
VADDPFSALGLPAWAGLTDDDVRAAWRRIAAATHPDREDGGDPVRFGAAAAAYVVLRTSFERGEALADLAAGGRPRSGQRHGGQRRSGQRPGGLGHGGLGRGRLRHCGARYGEHRHRHRERRQTRRGAHRVSAAGTGAGQPSAYRAAAARLARQFTGQFGLLTTGRGLGLRVISAALLAAATVAAVGVTPATIGLLAGALTVTGWALWRRGGWGR